MRAGLKARVFISCGQRKNSEEEKIANEIKVNLIELGFDPYIAIKEQISKGLKENIFQRLANSEYFIFIDFKREKIKGNECRGSLFANQELAIASFIDFPIIAFQEEGVKERDGILDTIQANPEKFSSRSNLAERVIEIVKVKLKEKEWDSDWRNELYISREDDDFEDENWDRDVNKPTRFFHIRVDNRHISRVAWKCLSYIEKIYDYDRKKDISFEMIENKWRGIANVDIQIPPKVYRKFDAIYINKNELEIAQISFNRAIVDRPKYDQEMILKNPGNYKISYVVYSENFSPTKAEFDLYLEKNIDNIQLKKIP